MIESSSQNQTPTKPSLQTPVVILSTMRSGSTLLKALLASAPDVSNIPEANFQRLTGKDAPKRLSALSKAPIVVLKRPGWFNEIGRYPKLPSLKGLKKIVLVRDVYENVQSLKKMAFRHFPIAPKKFGNAFFTDTYWARTNQTLIRLLDSDPGSTRLVKYEDLLKDPVAVTKKLFSFIGSVQKEGTETYPQPKNFDWRWGKDDGSANIKTLKVQKPKENAYEDEALLKTIRDSQRIAALRQRLGYPPLP